MRLGLNNAKRLSQRIRVSVCLCLREKHVGDGITGRGRFSKEIHHVAKTKIHSKLRRPPDKAATEQSATSCPASESLHQDGFPASVGTPNEAP